MHSLNIALIVQRCITEDSNIDVNRMTCPSQCKDVFEDATIEAEARGLRGRGQGWFASLVP